MMKVLDTSDHDIPQSRQRAYIVVIDSVHKSNKTCLPLATACHDDVGDEAHEWQECEGGHSSMRLRPLPQEHPGCLVCCGIEGAEALEGAGVC